MDYTSSTDTKTSELPKNSTPKNYEAPNNPILKSAFNILCIIAVSQKSLDHWKDTTNTEWEEHITMMINRFQNSNVTAGLVLATTTLFLSSEPPVPSLVAYDMPASYIFAMIAFGTALLSVISGTAVLVMYQASTTHQDMETLRDMSQHQIICLLLWLAYPSICLVVATCLLFLSLSPASALEIPLFMPWQPLVVFLLFEWSPYALRFQICGQTVGAQCHPPRTVPQ
ncbi:hypothetical protein DFH29DRAFT_995959 [Suillus ampliporus]|nr:hypothetical protein DFH29DRAFT_995959 [Suillus ampliporus]